jgi:hypothetical protein
MNAEPLTHQAGGPLQLYHEVRCSETRSAQQNQAVPLALGFDGIEFLTAVWEGLFLFGSPKINISVSNFFKSHLLLAPF